MAGVFARFRVQAISFGAAVLVLAGCAQSATPTASAGTTDVTIWTAWGGQELKAFKDVLAPFEKNTGIKVHITTVRDANQLAINVEAGTTLPDIAGAPTIDKIQDWVSKGVMKPIETALGDQFKGYIDNTYPGLTTPPGGQSDDLYIYVVGGKHYGLMVKSQVKGLIWYNKKVFTGSPPKTFDDLLAISPSQYGAKSLFCAGFESGDASGWPASDQIDNVIMRQTDSATYVNWINGKVKFSDPAIKNGYQLFLKEVAQGTVYGGPSTALSTNFGKAGDPLFTSPPGCLFLEQATFISNFFIQDHPGLVAGTDFDFFGHPSVNPQFDGNVNGFYDNFALYNDTPAARKLMQYMATKDAQQIWADDGGTLAGIKTINYKDPVFKRAAEIALGAKNLLVTAGDYMPSDLQHAFWKSLLNVTRDPNSLNSELAKLDQIQSVAYKG